MTISISEPDMALLFSGRAIVLVEQTLSHLVPVSSGYWDTLTFDGHIIGKKRGKALPLEDSRLPLAIILIVQRHGSDFGVELCRVLREAGHPLPPGIVSIKWWQAVGSRAQTAVAAALTDALEKALVSSTYSPLEMNRQISELRQHLERERAQNDRMSILMSHVGLSGVEFAIDNPIAGSVTPIPLPVRQNAPMSLRDLKQIAIYNLSNVPSHVQFELTIAGALAYSADLETLGQPGWLYIRLPESLVQSAADAVFHLRALKGDPEFAGTEGHLTCRFYWSEARGENLGFQELQTVLGTVRRPREPGVLLNGIWLEAGTNVYAETDDGYGFLNGQIALLPHGEIPVVTSKRLVNGKTGPSLKLSSQSSPVAGRYDVVLNFEKTRHIERDLVWRMSVTRPQQDKRPLSFAAARFATLRGAMEYCDGPRQEEIINNEVGYAVLSIADGQPFMQTHPVAEKVVGATFPQLVPIGTTRMWVDIENAHPQADSIEFILALRGELFTQSAQDWVTATARPEASTLTITDLPGGDVLARITMAPGTAQTLDIQLPAPLSRQSHLYCLVNCIGSSSRYGWCRWNSITFAVDESVPLT